MKNTLICILPILIIVLFISCRENGDVSTTCIEGIVSENLSYRTLISGCYSKTVWIEILNKDDLGVDVEIAFIDTDNKIPPKEPLKFFNVIAVPISNFDGANLNSLYGKKIFLELRNPNEVEIDESIVTDCTGYYDHYQVPLYIIQRFSINECPIGFD